MQDFQKSDIGAQSAWKGFSSQTLYIASRLVSDENGYEYFPEDVEDLVIKKAGQVIEAVQVKNISADLTLSSLASTNTSKTGDGFFKRMCSLHAQDSSFHCVRVVYFHNLGFELQQLEKGNESTKKSLAERLKNKHGLSAEEACWLIDSLSFDKACLDDLDTDICAQIRNYVPVMAAPNLAKELLIQYISTLSKSKGHTTLNMWQEKIHEIGVNIAAIDGFYKEYNKSLVRLSDLHLSGNQDEFQKEFSQGVSAHPTHIRHNLDFRRSYWLEKIQTVIEKNGVAIIKGISGQGKSTLSYRYLLDNYPEGCVFCVRAIRTERQAENLVAALDALGKYNKELIIYIDVQPGETQWAFLLQELQSRGISIPVLVSIRDEDYNLTPINGKSIKYDIIELSLSKDEAELIYDSFTQLQPHAIHRSFEEAWQFFGGQGPLIEFIYLLTNNQTLTQRLQEQIDALLQEGISDEWLELLQLVCYAGRLGCSVDLNAVKKEIQCSTIQAAIRRFKDEYLIRVVDDKKLEALHPVRAQIVSDVLYHLICTSPKDIVFKALSCVSSRSVRVILLDYFSQQQFTVQDIQSLSQVKFSDWIGYANAIKSMLWLDAKRYVDANMQFIHSMIEKHGKGWLCFLPLDLSGIDRPNELIADGLKDLHTVNKEKIENAIDEIKNNLTSLSIDYQATDLFIKNCIAPIVLPITDEDRTAFGYTLFWMSKRGTHLTLPFNTDELVKNVCNGELQSSADAIRGLSEYPELVNSYQASVDAIVKRLIPEMKIIYFSVNDDEVVCKFIPPLPTEADTPNNTKSKNQYWRMKMLDILNQLYPNIDYIDIELIGVDLLRELGIEALDRKLHIHKSKRPNYWATELNGWVKTRIDYSLRPSTWNEYVAKIDVIRKNVQELITNTIRLIDDIYIKERFTQTRGKRIENGMKIFRMHAFAENLLPQSVVDPYCLYSEGSQKHPDKIEKQYYTMHQVLSVSKYENFRKSLHDVYNSLDNFYNQFSPVLLARINKQEMDAVDNPRLAMFNLYSAAKNLPMFQREYTVLFSKYSSLSESFADEERESFLTLVNVWRHVLDNPIKNAAIAYDAKCRYRKGTTYFRDTLSKGIDSLKATLVTGDKYAYILVNYDVTKDTTLEKEYTNVVLKLRKEFEKGIAESSDRWYSETQPLELSYVPLFSGVFFPIAYSIPFYKLFDKEESHISDSTIPCEIESMLYEKMKVDPLQQQWIDAIGQLRDISLHLQRYQQVIQVQPNEICSSTLKSFTDSLCDHITELWNAFLLSKPLVDKILEEADEQSRELLDCVQKLYNCRNDINETIKMNKDPGELIQVIKTILGIMLIVQPAVLQYSTQHKSN